MIPWSNVLTTCGLLIFDESAASRLKRATMVGSSLATSAETNLTATSLSSDSWWATHTLPMPPLPSGLSRRTLLVT
jgi:hypothetical protein